MIVYRELSSLTADLGIPAKTLYAVSNDLDRHYRTAAIPKGSGGTRQLAVPDPLLKHIQQRIYQVLLIHMPVSPYAAAYRPGGSTLRAAAPHVGKPLVLRLDIREFFGSVLYTSVKDAAFPATIYAEPLRVLLTILCYYRDALPQGAPTSPAISNLLLRSFDEDVAAWCAGQQIAYSRYCDDMTFSGDFAPDPVICFVREKLGALGLFLNEKKTRRMYAGQRQSVTGLVVDQRCRVPAGYRRRLRQELYFCRRYGVSSHMQHTGDTGTPRSCLRRLLGQTDYVLHVTPNDREMQAYRTWLKTQLSMIDRAGRP